MNGDQTTSSETSPQEAPRSGEFKLGPVTIPLPRWAALTLAAVVVVCVSIYLFSKLVYPWVAEQLGQKQRETDAAEYQKHFDDRADPARHLDQVVYNDPIKGFLKITYYTSDGCLFLVRGSPDPHTIPIQHWIRASFYGELPPPPAPDGRLATRTSQPGSARRQPAAGQPEAPIPSSAILHLAVVAGTAPQAPVPMQACAGKCWNPHPGQFRSWNGQANGCWLQVFRQWPDGCMHYQYYNTCTGYWDSLPDGSPKVWWTCCIH
jgi:hypothetical protein